MGALRIEYEKENVMLARKLWEFWIVDIRNKEEGGGCNTQQMEKKRLYTFGALRALDFAHNKQK